MLPAFDGDELCCWNKGLHTSGIAVRHDTVFRSLHRRFSTIPQQEKSLKICGNIDETYPYQKDFSAAFPRLATDRSKRRC